MNTVIRCTVLIPTVLMTLSTLSDVKAQSISPVIQKRYDTNDRLGEMYLGDAVPLKQVGELPSSAQEQQGIFLHLPLGLRIDQDAMVLYVADNGSADIKIIGLSDESISTLGRSGQGPGEFSYPSRIGLLPDGSFWVRDMMRLQKFDSDQQLVSTIQPPFILHSFAAMPDGGFIIARGTLNEDRTLLARFDSEGNHLFDFGHIDPLIPRNPDPRQAATLGEVFIIEHDDRIVTVSGKVGTISSYDLSGQQKTHAMIDHPFISELRDLNVEFMRRMVNGQDYGNRILHYLISDMHSARDGSFWILTKTPPCIGIFKVQLSGAVTESFMWKIEDHDAYPNGLAVLELDDSIRFYLSAMHSANVVVLESSR